MPLPQTGIGASEQHAKLLLDSYRRWTGKELIPLDSGQTVREQLYQSPIVILSHGTESDPILNYGNQIGLDLWEMEWEQFIRTPSRLTAEKVKQEERDRFFEAVTANGFVDNYTSIRISSTGRRFYIINATVWNLIDDDNRYLGQAAAFSEYRYL
ncbi:MEKHLA domain-containing protein [Paenibacillus prosopidis]|uniref:MEKHLA domain-containing protein n=1 Tax=Paenibacillus prosopidis TaxID=630520 RepID=A0A368W5X0_9BACL|nr:MEKHLA domain-containing protein [Paenibacillus prosopidis]RCW49133.1 MEKHLA domain-containing protein [Paenibacillus prosopidis]